MIEQIDIVTALCDRHNRCTICYRETTGGGCKNCNEDYYLDCICTPMTPSEIVNDFDW